MTNVHENLSAHTIGWLSGSIFCLGLSACSLHVVQQLQMPLAARHSIQPNESVHVTGAIKQSDGTPLTDTVTVYIPNLTNVAEKLIKDLSISSFVNGRRTCQKPLEPYISYSCTDANGRFTLTIPRTAQFPVKLKFQTAQGNQESLLALDDIDSDLGIFQFDSQSIQQRKKIAIITNLIESVSANPVNDTQNNLSNEDTAEINRMELTQGFLKLYNIDDTTSEIEFPSFKSLFLDIDGDKKTDLFQFKAIYLNSQSGSELNELSQDIKQLLLEYVKQGGELYITSWKYDIEEPGLDQYI